MWDLSIGKTLCIYCHQKTSDYGIGDRATTKKFKKRIGIRRIELSENERKYIVKLITGSDSLGESIKTKLLTAR